jgi:hypothetical protein
MGRALKQFGCRREMAEKLGMVQKRERKRHLRHVPWGLKPRSKQENFMQAWKACATLVKTHSPLAKTDSPLVKTHSPFVKTHSPLVNPGMNLPELFVTFLKIEPDVGGRRFVFPVRWDVLSIVSFV